MPKYIVTVRDFDGKIRAMGYFEDEESLQTFTSTWFERGEFAVDLDIYYPRDSENTVNKEGNQ